MNTFLPLPDYQTSASVLDSLRLRKQQVECSQILDVLEGRSTGWANHPAVKQWVGHIDALKYYSQCIANECNRRGFNSKQFFFDEKFSNPAWFGKDEFHASHRSKLLFKGRLDSICLSIKKKLKVKSINKWLIDNGYPRKNLLTHFYVEQLENCGIVDKTDITNNHYKQFGWKEPDNLPYFWPSKNA